MTAYLDARQLPIGNAECDIETALIIRAWNMLGGGIDWSGVEPVADIFGFDDPERMIIGMVAIRDWQASNG